MPTRFGADGGFASTTSGGVFDSSGNPIISADNEFGGVPLGPAALAQTLFSVPNGTFNILPLDIEQPISNENPLPYWSSPVDNSDGEMIAQVVYDTTSNTYSLRMNPGSALSGDTLSITTRSAVISDDNLSLRQKAIATLAKVGTYAGTTQVNLKLDATYYDHTGTQISTNPIGTVFDNGTVSSITGFTTAGTAIVGVSAAYVDLTFTMTATANVTSGIAFDIDTILLQTSQGGGGGGGASSFIITETFTTSDTWTRPTGVENLLAIICVGGGGGGASGGLDIGTGSTIAGVSEGGGGGGSGAFAYLTNVYIGTAASFTVTVGAGGSGGTATTVSKADGSTTTTDLSPVQGAAGGTSSFGTLVYGNGASVTGVSQPYSAGGGGAFTSPIWGIQFQSATGRNGGEGGRSNLLPAGTASVAGTFVAGTYTSLPLVSTSIPTPGSPTAATAGTFVTSAIGAGSVFTAAGTAAATAGSGYFIQSGGGGGAGAIDSSSNIAVGAGGAGQPGAGGGGGGATVRITSGGTSNNGSVSVTGGDGGNATGTAGAGGGGGGGAFFRANTGTILGNVIVNATSGKGGNGSQGFVIISYVG